MTTARPHGGDGWLLLVSVVPLVVALALIWRAS